MTYIPYNKNLKENARRLRKEMTPPERKLWYEYLKHIEYPVKRQKPIANYIADFYCSKLRLVIEVDGSQHYTKEGMEYDKIRTAVIENYGIRVLRFTNYEVLKEFENVCRKIDEVIEQESTVLRTSPCG